MRNVLEMFNNIFLTGMETTDHEFITIFTSNSTTVKIGQTDVFI